MKEKFISISYGLHAHSNNLSCSSTQMGIDLELPSSDHDTLGSETNANDDFRYITDGMTVEEENLSSAAAAATEGVMEISGRNVKENIIIGDDRVESNIEPHIGLEFESKEAAYSFYRDYAMSVGFGITIKASRRSKKSGNFIDVKIACSRFGSKPESGTRTSNCSRSYPKTDCKAGMHMKRMPDGKWIINNILKQHNHEICPDEFYSTLQGRKKQSVVVACQKKGLQLALDEGDTQLMLEHFKHMQDESPSFFYAIDMDNEKRLKSVFWVDAKGKHDYRNFCDVVFFDTYYFRNKYKVPFVPIVGVNHHHQFILLGCALIGDAVVSTFVWLLQTWIKAVGGQAPNVIITEEDKSLVEAIKQVFPNSRHSFCLWDVVGKIRIKLGCVITEFENFFTRFEKCIHRSWTDEQFEKRWWKLVDKFQLRDNEYFVSLYEVRKMWVPSCMKDAFFAGISTTERSESMISFFDAYLSRETTFKEFLEHYRAFLQESYELEAKADFEARRGRHALQSLSSFEKQVSVMYTNEVFHKFQIEIMGLPNCQLQKESEDNATAVFRVNDTIRGHNFIVSWNKEKFDVRCVCGLFEHKGILCRHALLVLQISGVSNIPSHYILKRWTKDAKIRETVTDIPKGFNSRLQRFNELCTRAITLCEEGSLSRENYDIAFGVLGEALKQCASINRSAKRSLDPNKLAINAFIDFEENNYSNGSKPSKKKKTYKSRKVHLESEAISRETQDGCQQMEQSRSRDDTLDNCYVPHQGMHEMDGGSRTVLGYYGAQQSMQGVLNLIQDDYYSNQQNIHGLGQLNSISTHNGHFSNEPTNSISTHNGHFSNEPSIHEMGQLGFRAPAIHGCFDLQDDLEGMEPSMRSTQFHNISSKHMNDKKRL